VSACVFEGGFRKRICQALMLQRRGNLSMNERQHGDAHAEQQESYLLTDSNLNAIVIEIQLNWPTLATDDNFANSFGGHAIANQLTGFG
jgi:hypothetical protein